ncbi:MAG: biopolymer transporter ExbD [Proteobacteria bacterium]|nr:biopolymer transporter ExbD [Pseudomonadota bacterium]
MKLSTSHQKKVRIEMLPLIDVVFLLLVFFIYAMLSMSIHRGLAVDLPISASTSIETSHSLVVTINENGQIYVDQSPVSADSFRKILSSRIIDLKKPLILVSADGQVSYQQLFSVMDDIKATGIHRISLQAEQEIRK